MNQRLNRTLALLAVLFAAAPAAIAAELGPQPTAAKNASNAPGMPATDKATEAQRLAAMAAQLAQQAAQLAAESNATAPTAATPAVSAPASALQADWSPRDAAQVQVNDAADTTLSGDSSSNGWRKHRKAEDIAIRFKGQEAPSTPASTVAAAPIATTIVAMPAATNSAISIAQGSSQLDAAAAGTLLVNHLLNDTNVMPAARTFQDEDSMIPDAEPVPPAPSYGNGTNGSTHDGDNVAEPLPAGGPAEYCGCDSGCEPCCPQRVLFWTAGTEATFLTPDLNSDGESFEVEEFSKQRDDFFSTTTDDIDSFYVAPRVWIGVQGCKWGANLRYWHMTAGEGSFDPIFGRDGEWDGPGCGSPDIGYTSCNEFEAYAVDLEVTRRLCLRDCAMQFSAGVRHAEVTQDESIFGAALADDSTLFGFGTDHRETRGTGLVFGWYGRRPIFPCSCVHWFYNARLSTLWGPTNTSSETGVLLTLQTNDPDAVGNAGSVNGASTHVSDTLFIGEIQLGLEWEYGLRRLPANAFFRTALEYQRWDGGRGFSAANSFAGVEIDGDPTTFAETTASASEPQLDLVGFTIGTGLTW